MLPEVVVFASAHFEGWCASGSSQCERKKNFHPPSVFFSCAMLFLNCESMDWIVDICFAAAMSRLRMCVWKSFICAGSAATFLGVGNTSQI